MFGRKKNPQDLAIADLAKRSTPLPKAARNSLVHSNGEYVHPVNPQDLANAHALFGHLPPGQQTPIVAYLVPQVTGEVLIEVNGVAVDRLTEPSAKKCHGELAGPTPVKLVVTIINAKRKEHQKPTINLTPDTTYP